MMQRRLVRIIKILDLLFFFFCSLSFLPILKETNLKNIIESWAWRPEVKYRIRSQQVQ